MTMVSTGPISIGGSATSGGLNQSINIELGRAATATSSLNETALRTLAGVPSGAISLANFYGKANTFSFTISASAANVDLRAAAVAAGWTGSAQVICTIASGVTISSASTGSPALTIAGSFPGGVALTNNGIIIGRGGDGGRGAGFSFAGQTGFSGGTALSVSTAVTIQNNNAIYGGGGGGGGGGSSYGSRGTFRAGGGGGGGVGVSTGGAAGPTGGAVAGGSTAGGNGTLTTVGAGGTTPAADTGGRGGAGGSYGSVGSNGVNATTNYGTFFAGRTGGAAGSAVTGNSNITWTAFGTRTGPIS